MYTVIAILIVIASIILTLVVLVQNSKGGGLAANFASGNQTFGVRKTADFLENPYPYTAPLPSLSPLVTTSLFSISVSLFLYGRGFYDHPVSLAR